MMDSDRTPDDAAENGQPVATARASAMASGVVDGSPAAPPSPPGPPNTQQWVEDPDARRDRNWTKYFDRRQDEARVGFYHPSVPELLMGMSPFRASYDVDAQTSAERLLARLTVDGTAEGELAEALRAVTVSPTRGACRAAAEALNADWSLLAFLNAPFLAPAAARFEFFAAVKNCSRSALLTGSRALAYALMDDWQPSIAKRALVQRALGWLLIGGYELPDVFDKRGRDHGVPPPAIRAAELGAEAIRQIDNVFHA